MTGLLAAILIGATAVPGVARPEEAVHTGRDALDRWLPWNEYPWYDDDADGVRRIETPEPWYMKWGPGRRWTWRWWKGWRGWRGWRWPAFGRGFNLKDLWPGTLLEWCVWIGIAAVLGLLVFIMVRFARKYVRADSSAGSGDGDEADEEEDHRRVEALPLGARRKRTGLLEEARRHYEAGNYQEAIIYLFSYQLVQLDKHHLIRLAKGKTNRQYVRELGRRGTLRRMIEQTMVAFEDVFFGQRTLPRGRFETCWSRLDRFHALVEEGAG
jgi:hypothetical protein